MIWINLFLYDSMDWVCKFAGDGLGPQVAGYASRSLRGRSPATQALAGDIHDRGFASTGAHGLRHLPDGARSMPAVSVAAPSPARGACGRGGADQLSRAVFPQVTFGNSPRARMLPLGRLAGPMGASYCIMRGYMGCQRTRARTMTYAPPRTIRDPAHG
jgi:hypothetical protein